MKVLQILAFPFSLLYGIVVYLRNTLYDHRILKSTTFNIPIISIGNLSMGGTGKSPHLEYLIELLGTNNIATLSRGYGRKTKGFFIVSDTCTAEEVGDEPLQFKKKHQQLLVAVCEDRVKGINELLKRNPTLRAILLDDAFQHRKIKPGLSILLTDYSRPFYDDFILPYGTLREPRSESKRANIIVVTKIPEQISEREHKQIIEKIKPLAHQQVYFSKIIYGGLKPIDTIYLTQHEVLKEFFFDNTYSIILFTGIANSDSLLKHLRDRAKEVQHIKFSDHHQFTLGDIEKICKTFEANLNKNKIIITTEKDAIRLSDSEVKTRIGQIPLYYIPIKISFEEKDHVDFNNQIQNYVGQNT